MLAVTTKHFEDHLNSAPVINFGGTLETRPRKFGGMLGRLRAKWEIP
jgi:hypothetical protein